MSENSVQLRSNTPDLTGRVFGSLTVLDFAFYRVVAYWNCLCKCGSERTIKAYNLLSGNTKSCGRCIKNMADSEYMETVRKRLLSRVKVTESGCWEFQGNRHEWGYGKIKVRRFDARAHVISYKLFVGEVPEGLWVLHKCDNPPCVNPSHLFLGTVKDNVEDMIHKGRNIRGESHKNSKLTQNQVNEIRAARGLVLQKDLAEKYKVCKQTICLIMQNRIWKS